MGVNKTTPHTIVSATDLSPVHVAGYLRSSGWQDSGRYGPFGQLYTLENNTKTYQAVVPRTRTVDFERRMLDVAQAIADAEGRTVNAVVSELAITLFDVIRVRALVADSYGSISLPRGLGLYSEANKLLTASALSAASMKARRAWKGRRPEIVESYMAKVRLGQTENLSYSITLLSPYSFDKSDNENLFDDPFGRRVSLRLGKTLDAVGAALEEAVSSSDPVAIFSEYVPAGVSADVCQSLADLAENDGGIEVSVSWSPGKPVEKPKKIHLKPEQAAVLRDVAKAFSQQEPEPDYEIEGIIELIKGEGRRTDGSVVILAPRPGGKGVRRVRVYFDEASRHTVYDAARDQKIIQVTGDLEQLGNKLVLRNPRGFSTLEIPDDEETGAS